MGWESIDRQTKQDVTDEFAKNLDLSTFTQESYSSRKRSMILERFPDLSREKLPDPCMGINYAVLRKIYDGLDPLDKNQIEATEKQLRLLIELDPEFRNQWNETVNVALANIILYSGGTMNFTINSYEEYENVFTSWMRVGFDIQHKLIQSKLLKKLKSFKGNLESHKEYRRVIDIMQGYAFLPQFNSYIKEHIKPKLSRQFLEKEIARVDNDANQRPTINGRYQRNTDLAYYLKFMYNFTCAVCDSSGSRDIRIEASHNIPLSLGTKYSRDISKNITVLCHTHHMEEEELFWYRWDKLKTDEEKEEFLTKRFSYYPYE